MAGSFCRRRPTARDGVRAEGARAQPFPFKAPTEGGEEEIKEEGGGSEKKTETPPPDAEAEPRTEPGRGAAERGRRCRKHRGLAPAAEAFLEIRIKLT